MMKTERLSTMAVIDISNVDKKSKDGEKPVRLCNFVDVYHNWSITKNMYNGLMSATANDNQIARFSIKKGQVAITKDSETRDDIGIPAYMADDFDDVVLGYHCALITPKDRVLCGAYLNVVLHSPYAGKYFEANASGSGQRYTLTNEIIGNFPVPMIPFEEQERIAAVFEPIDRKIEINNAIISELESMAKDIYDYWFVQFDFPDANGKPYQSSGGKMVWNENLKREIPEGWTAGHFGDVLISLECGDRPSGGAENSGIPSVGAENIIGIGKYNTSSEKYISESYFNSMKTGVVQSWDVLMYKDGAGVGQASMFGDGFPYERCAVNSHAFILRSDNCTFQNYLYLTLCQPYVKKLVIALAMKAAQPGLNQPAVKSIPIIIPNLNVLIDFNKIIDPLFHMIFTSAKENMELASLRDWLLPMLMNGQVKVVKEKRNLVYKQTESYMEAASKEETHLNYTGE